MDNPVIWTGTQTSGLRFRKLYSERPRDRSNGVAGGNTVKGYAAAWHGTGRFGDDEIAALAIELWRIRGCPEDSLEKDWLRAREILRSGAYAG